eukprot:TRINITY_DN10218_c0_g3_i1.p1 TRINITY_DN10218_c0_g3~~TRINITY_DN10218_c0_g3_i1.p1  ORF type:complete len:417 (+),score=113.62 TRINITY_DN10218_c0_g3_i1:116-1366(+)
MQSRFTGCRCRWLVLALCTTCSVATPSRQGGTMRRAQAALEPSGAVEAVVQALSGDSDELSGGESVGAAAEQRIATLEAQVLSLQDTVQSLVQELTETRRQAAETGAVDFVRRPSTMKDGLAVQRELGLADRVRYLERKLDGATNWLSDPQLWRRQQHVCRNMSDVGTSGEHHVCFDNWERQLKKDAKKPCVVYDLGIRANPEFGATMLDKYGCAVRAYDPSEIAMKWWKGTEEGTIPSKTVRASGPGRYNFSAFAAGGLDGGISLFKFNWQQVSIVHGEVDLTLDPKYRKMYQQEFKVQAKTLPTMMKDHGDDNVDVLKVDIEGSEYAFLQQAFDVMGCPPVGQITVEYHNFQLDERYGSSPEINTLHNLLNACGFKSFMVRDHWRNFVREETDDFYLPPKRFTLASYCKHCWQE